MSEGASTSRFILRVEYCEGTATVHCAGRLVAGVGDLLYDRVRELTPASRHVVLDLTDLTHMDSSGLGTLVRAYVHAKSASCTLELINIGKPIRQLLGITHLLDVFETIGRHNIRMG